MFTLEIIRIF